MEVDPIPWKQMEAWMEVDFLGGDGGSSICFRGSFHLLTPRLLLTSRETPMEVNSLHRKLMRACMEAEVLPWNLVEASTEVDGIFCGSTPKTQIVWKLGYVKSAGNRCRTCFWSMEHVWPGGVS